MTPSPLKTQAAHSPAPFADKPGLSIGGIPLPTRVFMAPMVGYNEPPLRRILRRFGSSLITTEMIKPEALDPPSKSLLKELALGADEYPAAAQISACEPEPALKAAVTLRSLGFHVIDINFGCPLKKECSKGRGAAMMLEPRKVAVLINTLVKELDCPITVKMRSGWSDEEPTSPEIARVAVDNGASAICVHGRSKLGWYSTKNDHEIIRKTREAVPEIPFIANGDVKDVESALALFQNTQADAIMIGRASVGNPWLFQRINSALTTGEIPPQPNYQEIRAVYDEHSQALFNCLKKKNALRYSRKYALYYFAQFLTKERRQEIAGTRTREKMVAFIDQLADITPRTICPLAALRE
jgi:tRNA-dihydrouridine synthase B